MHQEIAYILFCPQIQTETRPQKSSKLLRVLQFSGRHFSCSIQTLKMMLTESLITLECGILLQIPKLQSIAKMESWSLSSFFNFQFILCTKVEEVKPPWQSNRVSKLANNAHWRPFTTNCNLCRQR